MTNNHLAVTIVLRVAIVTTSLAGIAAMFAIVVSRSSPRADTLYTVQTYPSITTKLGLAFVVIMWTSTVLSFLCYMLWRVRSSTAGAASRADLGRPPGAPPTPNFRREALD